MSEIMTIAEAVTKSLAEYDAELLFCPEFNLSDIKKMRVVVVPVGTEFKSVSRASHEERPKVQIGILKKITEDEFDDMLRFVEKLGLGFLRKKFDDATCVTVAFNPIYSAEHFRERGQFTSVIELTFAVVRS